MKKLIPVCFIFFAVACTDDTTPEQGSGKRDFFPVTSFLKEQVNEVDSFKLPVHKYSTFNKKTDSVLISQDEFNSFAKEFMEPDINDATIKKFYNETSFADQSIPSITFTYSTGNKKLTLQRMDVIVNPDQAASNQVKSIYLEKLTRNGDTSILQKMYWKTNRYFQIISSKTKVGQAAVFNEVKIAWSATD